MESSKSGIFPSSAAPTPDFLARSVELYNVFDAGIRTHSEKFAGKGPEFPLISIRFVGNLLFSRDEAEAFIEVLQTKIAHECKSMGVRRCAASIDSAHLVVGNQPHWATGFKSLAQAHFVALNPKESILRFTFAFFDSTPVRFASPRREGGVLTPGALAQAAAWEADETHRIVKTREMNLRYGLNSVSLASNIEKSSQAAFGLLRTFSEQIPQVTWST